MAVYSIGFVKRFFRRDLLPYPFFVVISAIFFIIPTLLFAAPQIGSVSGNLTHKNSVTVRGQGFGAKSPATPLWWDDGEGAATSTIGLLGSDLSHVTTSKTAPNRRYSAAWPPSGCAASHQIRYERCSYRGTPCAHSRSTKYLTGGHKDYASGTRWGNKVGVSVDAGSPQPVWYVSFYYRVDQLWPAPGSGENQKYTRYSDQACSYGSAENTAYWQIHNVGAGGGNTQSHTNQSVCGYRGNMGSTANPSGSVQYFNSNPDSKWVHVEDMFKQGTGGFWRLIHDNQIGYDAQCTDPLSAVATSYRPRSATVGGFWRNKIDGREYQNDNAWRYFDDIYIDNTFSRVVLANASAYEAASIVEPQIPSVWSDSSITVSVNLGMLPNTGTAYLFVFDANNNHNPTGYPVTIGGGGGGPLLSAPANLRIR